MFFGQGQTVEKKLLFFSPEWLDAVHHAASEADRLGLEMTIFSSQDGKASYRRSMGKA